MAFRPAPQVVEAADEPDGLYRWHVALGGFSPDSLLAKVCGRVGGGVWRCWASVLGSCWPATPRTHARPPPSCLTALRLPPARPSPAPAYPRLQDMHQAGRRFGTSSVQLQLVFKRPLHPFYPPSVQLVSPRFQGPILRCVRWSGARWGG